ncbi:MAG: winged helix-turn-helix domain-containing protein [Alphaproteobacteria bacterium]
MRILVVEDDPTLATFVLKGLTEAGHVADGFADGRDAMTAAITHPYDVAVVDRMLPGLDGLSLVRALRSAKIDLPVLFLTSLSGVDDRVEGLEAGGGDYLTKPFAFSELLARVNALSRRSPLQSDAAAAATTISKGDVTLDLVRRTATRAGRQIDLNPKEFLILEVLMRADGRILTRTMLLEKVWDIHFDPQTSVVETHISRLRAKIERPFGDPPLIRTIRGSGYAFDV